MASHLLLQPTDDTESDFAQVSYSDYLNGLAKALEVNSDETKMNTSHDALGRFGSGGGGGASGGASDFAPDARGVTETEGKALEQYALFSMQLNADLRDGAPLTAKDQQNIAALDSAISSSQSSKQKLLYRSIPAESVANLEVGSTITDKAYMSTSKQHDVAQGLLGITGKPDTLLQINAPKGTQGIDVNRALGNRSEYADQHEVLLPRGTQLRVTLIRDIGRYKTIYAEIVTDSTKMNTNHDARGRFGSGVSGGGAGGAGSVEAMTGGLASSTSDIKEINLNPMDHQTKPSNVASIQKNGFNLASNGMYGQGVYFSDRPEYGTNAGLAKISVSLKPHTQLVIKDDTDISRVSQALVGKSPFHGESWRTAMIEAGYGSIRMNMDSSGSGGRNHTMTVVLDPKLISITSTGKAFDIPEIEENDMDDETKMNRNHDARGRFGSGGATGTGGGGGITTGADGVTQGGGAVSQPENNLIFKGADNASVAANATAVIDASQNANDRSHQMGVVTLDKLPIVQAQIEQGSFALAVGHHRAAGKAHELAMTQATNEGAASSHRAAANAHRQVTRSIVAIQASTQATAASENASAASAKVASLGGAAAPPYAQGQAAVAHAAAGIANDTARQSHFTAQSGKVGDKLNDSHSDVKRMHSDVRDVHEAAARGFAEAAGGKSFDIPEVEDNAMDDETKMNRNHDARGRFGSGASGGSGGGDGAGRVDPSGGGNIGDASPEEVAASNARYGPNTGGTAEPTEAVRRVQAESRDANGSSADMGFMRMGKIAIIQGQIEQGQYSRAIAHHKEMAQAHDGERSQQLARIWTSGTPKEAAYHRSEGRENGAAGNAHRAVVASLEKLAAAPKSFDTPEDEGLQIYTGFEVKALGNGKVGGYLVRYSQANSPDLVGDYFTDKSDLGTQTSLPVLYHHGQDKTIGKRVIGTGTLRKDAVGVWVETQLALRDDYEKHIYKLAEQGKLGWSSGSVSHLVERETKGKGVSWVKSWWVAEASLTPTPAEPQNHAFTKGHQPPNLEDDLLEESDDGVEPTADIVTKTEDTEMSEETIDELKAAIAGLTKRLDEPKVEAGKMAAFVKTVGGDHDGGYAFKHWIRTGVMNSYTKNNEQDWTATKTNVLNETTGTEGGILVPEGLYTTIIAKRDEMSIIRANGAMVIQTNLDSVQVPVENARMTTAIVAESGSYVAAEPTFTSNVVPIYKFGNQLRLTDELVSDEQTNIMGYLSNGLGRAFGLMENQYCIAGTGSSQPKGLLTGGTAAVTAASTTAITAAELVSLYHALPEPYTSNPSEVIFVTRNATLGALRALASSSIFTFNLQPQGDQGAQQLYGHKVAVSGYMQAATTGQKSILVTNLAAGYIMCERAGMVMQRNPYLLQATGQIALFSTMRFGGTTTVAEATQILTQA